MPAQNADINNRSLVPPTGRPVGLLKRCSKNGGFAKMRFLGPKMPHNKKAGGIYAGTPENAN